MPLSVVILAAGQGTRMRSRLPKVLHRLAGRPLLAHVCDTAATLGADAVHVVVGHEGEQVQRALAGLPVQWALQSPQLGTGHALAQALPLVPDDHTVLVLYGDVPLVRPQTLQPLLAATAGGGAALLTVRLADPAGYGRILRDAEGAVTGIVEHRDASPEQQAIDEVNTGILAAGAADLRRWVERLGNDNAQGEYYLTDCIAMAVADGVPVTAVVAEDDTEVSGVNDRAQLATLEREWQRREAERLMGEGVTLADPARIDVRGQLIAGHDVEIDVGCVFEGRVVLADGARVGPYSVLRDSELGAGAEVRSHCVLESARVGAGAIVGPFARLRPDAELAARAHVGNFVEVKNARIGEGSKANHLSYIGDADVGRDVNIGAGTITCNYDGAFKHRTVIEDGAFIGSDTQLVAPVTVGAGATLGAGTTLTRDAPAGKLTLTRARQVTVDGWQRPRKQRD